MAHGLKTEAEALRIESAVIGIIGIQSLANEVQGHDSDEFGRIPLTELTSRYENKTVEIFEPTMLIRINRFYRSVHTEQELYEATRGKWKVGTRRDKAKYVCAVFRGIIREVYRIEKWVPSGSTLYKTSLQRNVHIPGRWEFVGFRADEATRNKYLNKSVEKYLNKGAQNPIKYLNC